MNYNDKHDKASRDYNNDHHTHGRHHGRHSFNWAAVGAVVLIVLLLGWFLIVDADGDPNNGFIAPLMLLGR